jgi:hypothetical protein
MIIRCLALLGAAGLSLSGQEIGRIPAGFTSILKNDSLDGWHISQTSRSGNTQFWKVQGGTLTISQDKPGNGGLLVTNRTYKDYEVYLEVWPDWGCDGSLYLRTYAQGAAYQVMIDYLEKGFVGGIYLSKDLPEAKPGGRQGGDAWVKVWRKDAWNSVRARIEGANAHITTWVNGTQVADYTMPKNYLPGGAVDGSIGLHVHHGDRWAAGKVHRYRNIAVREIQ